MLNFFLHILTGKAMFAQTQSAVMHAISGVALLPLPTELK